MEQVQAHPDHPARRHGSDLIINLKEIIVTGAMDRTGMIMGAIMKVMGTRWNAMGKMQGTPLIFVQLVTREGQALLRSSAMSLRTCPSGPGAPTAYAAADKHHPTRPNTTSLTTRFPYSRWTTAFLDKEMKRTWECW